LGAKTLIYWVGFLIVAFSVLGLTRGLLSLAFPWTPLKIEATRFAGMAARSIVFRLVASFVFLTVGLGMMISEQKR